MPQNALNLEPWLDWEKFSQFHEALSCFFFFFCKQNLLALEKHPPPFFSGNFSQFQGGFFVFFFFFCKLNLMATEKTRSHFFRENFSQFRPIIFKLAHLRVLMPCFSFFHAILPPCKTTTATTLPSPYYEPPCRGLLLVPFHLVPVPVLPSPFQNSDCRSSFFLSSISTNKTNKLHITFSSFLQKAKKSYLILALPPCI